MSLESTQLYFPLYRGWVFDKKPFFRDPFHALVWQYWNICRDGLNYYWVDSRKKPKWHKCIGMIEISELDTMYDFHKNPQLWKVVLNKFFSKVDIYYLKKTHSIFDILIVDKNGFSKCTEYFTLPDYQRSIRSTIKGGSICGSIDFQCFSKLRIKKGIPEKKNTDGLIEIGCVVQTKIKQNPRNAGKLCNYF